MWLCGGGYSIRHQVKMEKLLTIQDVCDLLQVSKSLVYKWVHYRFIPHLKIGTKVRFKKSQLEVWLKRRQKKGRNMVQIRL